MDISNLISELTPLYNIYCKNRDSNLPIKKVVLMWEFGGVLKKYLDTHTIAPHTLYREIYGKSESSRNVSQRSYITREFLGRSYRVRNIFKNQKEIRDFFPNLTSLSHFREAMPFFDNPKHKLVDKELAKLLDVINSQRPNSEKKNYIDELQKSKIGKKNSRTQHLGEMQKDKELFVHFYNKVYTAIREKNFTDAIDFLNLPDIGFVNMVAQNTGALSADGLKMTDMTIPNDISEPWRSYSALVERLIKKESPIERRRFRRLIPADRLLRLSELLFALTDKKSFDTAQNRK